MLMKHFTGAVTWLFCTCLRTERVGVEGTQKIPSWFILIYGGKQHIISLSWNVTGINNPIKSNTVQLYLSRQCLNDCREAGRLPLASKVNKMLCC